MINYAVATSPSSPHPRRARAVAVAFTGWFDVARRALLNRRPEVNAATACPVHLVGIPDDAEDSGSSVVQEQGGNNPSHSATEARAAQHVLPLFEPRGCNKRWRTILPLRNGELLAFLVKASELSVSATLALSFGGFAAMYYPKQDLGGMPKSDGKIYFILVTLAMYKYTVWVSSMAKAAEHNRSGLSTLSVHVIVIFSYLVLLGAFVTHCVTGAAIWEIAPVAIIVIVIMLAKWAMTFSRPKILRRFFFCWGCFGRDPADARATEEEIVAQECNDSASSAKAAFIAKLRSKGKADIAKVRADEASEIQAKAVQELAVAKNRAEKTFSDLEIGRERVLNDEADAGSVQLLREAKNAYVAALKARVDATKGALKVAVDVHNKKIEAREAGRKAKSAATIARRERRRAMAAKEVSEL